MSRVSVLCKAATSLSCRSLPPVLERPSLTRTLLFVWVIPKPIPGTIVPGHSQAHTPQAHTCAYATTRTSRM